MSNEFKDPLSRIIVMGPASRVGRMKWWFLVLVILGLWAAVFTVFREFNVLSDLMRQRWSHLNLPLAPVELFAAEAQGEGAIGAKSGDAEQLLIRTYMMVGVFVVIGLITMMSLGMTLFGKDEKRVAAASDTLKTCIGFFIGVATKFF